MYANADLIKDFERNRLVIGRQADGLTHADSLIQPPGRANCLNWTIGHIVVHRDLAVRVCDGEPVIDHETTRRYERESEPITGDGPGVIRLDGLLDLLDTSQERLAEVLADIDLERMTDVGDRRIPLWKRIHFLYFHDTYHTGQTEFHRALAGFDDRVI